MINIVSAKFLRPYFFYGIAFILAFCSIAYELILAQSLAAFLENTVLRYSVTIGLYMFSMGFGALAAEGRLIRYPVLTLLKVETGLTIIGGFSVVFLHTLDFFTMSRVVFSFCAHGLIVFIGILTGLEIPLLIEIGRMPERNRTASLKYFHIQRLGRPKVSEPVVSGYKVENKVLAVDYLGAFSGTVIFAFLFYPRMGLVPSAFLTGMLNAVAGLVLFFWDPDIEESKKGQYYNLLSIQALLLLIVGLCWLVSDKINYFFGNHYMG